MEHLGARDDDADTPASNVPPISQGAAWDAADASIVFQGDALRNVPFYVWVDLLMKRSAPRWWLGLTRCISVPFMGLNS